MSAKKKKAKRKAPARKKKKKAAKKLTKKVSRKKSSKKSSKKASGERAYDGASRAKRLSKWRATGTSANNEVQRGGKTLRDRARDLVRNNPYARKGKTYLTGNVVGEGIRTMLTGSGTGFETLATIFKNWALSRMIDFDERLNLLGLQRLIFDAIVESGEVLVKRIIDTSLDFPLQYQVLEADFLDDSKSNTINAENDNIIIQGIEFNKKGKRVAYWVHERHPGSSTSQGIPSSAKSVRVPATEIYHYYIKERPGQERGVTMFAPVVVRLKDIDDYQDAEIVKQKIASCFAAFIQDLDSNVETIDKECDDLAGAMVEPGLIEELPRGKTVTFSKPPENESYDDFIKTNLHAVASGLNATYEGLTTDFSDVNFSSARMAFQVFELSVKSWRNEIFIYGFLADVMKDFLTFAELLGSDVNGVGAKHLPPKRIIIDPTKEIPATLKAIRGGLTSLTEEVIAMGKDPKEHFAQLANDNKLMDDFGLTLDTDARKVSANGIHQGGEEEAKTPADPGVDNE